MKRAMIAMSGGVDSSVAAYLMKEAGYDCMGVTMKLYENMNQVPAEKSCCSVEDIEDAKNICARLGMLYQVADFQADFQHCVVDRFISCYEHGATPNPCIDCNQYMKFDKLYEIAMEKGFDYVVTGHYAQVSYDVSSGRYQLRKGIDETKDQSYVLYMLSQEELAHVQFPIGSYCKTQIREIAEAQGFINARKHDSQDICFIPDGDYTGFLEEAHGGPYPQGNFVSTDGEILGTHKGIIAYTVGQRKGLGISSTEPYYVCELRTDTNEVVLGRKADLERTALEVSEFHWLSIAPPDTPIACTAKIRYSHKGAPAIATRNADESVSVRFQEPVRGVAKGQACVLYQEDLVLGGGRIL